MQERAESTRKTIEKGKASSVVTRICQAHCRHPVADSVATLQKSAGNRTVQGLFHSGIIHAKLKIGQPNDVHEQEADRVADRVMRMHEPAIQMKPG